jgi:serine/threonine protein kinase
MLIEVLLLLSISRFGVAGCLNSSDQQTEFDALTLYFSGFDEFQNLQSIKDLKIGANTYSVRRRVINCSDTFPGSNNKSDAESQNLISKMANELELLKFFEADKSLSSTIEQSKQLFEVEYFKKICKRAGHINHEVDIMEQISSAQPENPHRMKFRFNFCIRASGFQYLFFIAPHGPSLKLEMTSENAIMKSLVKRTEVYAKMVKSLHFVHSLGIVYCNVAPSSFFWSDFEKTDIIMEDYKLAKKGFYCSSSKAGYAAPEVYGYQASPKSSKDRYKVDSFSFGGMILDFELTALNPNFKYQSEFLELEKTKTDDPSYHAIIQIFERYKKEVEEISKGKNEDEKEFYLYYSKSIVRLIEKLIDYSAKKRYNMKRLYIKIWKLYQICKFEQKKTENFKAFKSFVNEFISDNDTEAGDIFNDFPLEWSINPSPIPI